MHPAKHLVSGIILGGLLYAVSQDAGVSALSGISAVAVDTDHFLEYGLFCLKNGSKPSVKEFANGAYFPKKGTVMVIFHAYEYVALLLIGLVLSLLFSWGSWAVLGAILLGYTLHMVLDVIGNEFKFLGYSIVYRIRCRFDEKTLCGKC